MIAENQQDEQPECAIVLCEDFQSPPVVLVDGSDDLFATHITRERKTLFWLPVILQGRTVSALIDTCVSRNLISSEIMKLFFRPQLYAPRNDDCANRKQSGISTFRLDYLAIHHQCA